MKDQILNIVQENFHHKINIYPRREGLYQLILPIYFDDGDMIDIYLSSCPDNKDKIRILDCGMTLMRLSYTDEVDDSFNKKKLEDLLHQHKIQNKDGNLYLDTSKEFIYQNIMQFIGCQQKIYDLRLFNAESIQSFFFEKLDKFIKTELQRFKPKKSVIPLKDIPILKVDYAFEFCKKPFYLFGVNNKEKANNSTIALIEFQKAKLSFISLIVHENIQKISETDQIYLTQNADKQFTSLDIFKQFAGVTIERLSV